MHLTNQVTPTKEEFEDFIKNYPSQTPLVMLNILKFKSQSGIGDESGEEAYNRYSENVKPLLDKVGAKPIWAGNVTKTLIGDYTSQPDRVLIVYYPSKEAFIKRFLKADSLADLARFYVWPISKVKGYRTRINTQLTEAGVVHQLDKLPNFTDSQQRTYNDQKDEGFTSSKETLANLFKTK